MGGRDGKEWNWDERIERQRGPVLQCSAVFDAVQGLIHPEIWGEVSHFERSARKEEREKRDT